MNRYFILIFLYIGMHALLLTKTMKKSSLLEDLQAVLLLKTKFLFTRSLAGSGILHHLIREDRVLPVVAT